MTPDDVIQYRTDRKVDVAAFKDILERSGLERADPVGDPARLARMLAAYNLVLTAWRGEVLVGVATCWTDYAHSGYLADLAVDADCRSAPASAASWSTRP